VPSVQDLLRQAIQAGDDQSVRQVKGHHLPKRLLADLVRQTHEYAIAPTPPQMPMTDGSYLPTASSRGGAAW
jgi:hypothetical protein